TSYSIRETDKINQELKTTPSEYSDSSQMGPAVSEDIDLSQSFGSSDDTSTWQRKFSQSTTICYTYFRCLLDRVTLIIRLQLIFSVYWDRVENSWSHVIPHYTSLMIENSWSHVTLIFGVYCIGLQHIFGYNLFSKFLSPTLQLIFGSVPRFNLFSVTTYFRCLLDRVPTYFRLLLIFRCLLDRIGYYIFSVTTYFRLQHYFRCLLDRCRIGDNLLQLIFVDRCYNLFSVTNIFSSHVTTIFSVTTYFRCLLDRIGYCLFSVTSYYIFSVTTYLR
ncbi:hypothetical protein L9F63_027556, partial [Diploptera punctata]